MLSYINLLNINVYDGNDVFLGKCDDITLDKLTGKCLLYIEGRAYSSDKVLLKNGKLTLNNPQIIQNNYKKIIGKSVYSSLGKHIGTLRNLTFGKTLNIIRITCDNGQEFSRGRIHAVDDIIVIKVTKPKTSAKYTAKKDGNSAAVNKTKTLMQTIDNGITVGLYPIKRRYGDFNFLLGKTADKNITNFYNEVMIKNGDRVTVETLRQAKLSGKLIELCLHVK